MLVLAIILSVERLYNKALFNVSADFIVSLHASLKSNWLDQFFSLYSAMSDIEVYYIAFLIALSFAGTARGYYYCCMISAIWVTKNFAKLVYHEPRPYMTDDRVLTIDCEKDFGNPSGHSTQSAAFAVFFVLDIGHRRFSSFKLGVALGLACLYFMLVGFGGVYQGLHSLN